MISHKKIFSFSGILHPRFSSSGRVPPLCGSTSYSWTWLCNAPIFLALILSRPYMFLAFNRQNVDFYGFVHLSTWIERERYALSVPSGDGGSWRGPGFS